MSDFDGAVEAFRRLSYERRIFALAESVKRNQDPGIPPNGAGANPDGHLNGTMDHEAAENGAPLSSFNLLPDL